MPNGKPNILVMWGDDIGQFNLSCYSHGVMGYRTPNIDRIAREGLMFTDYYGEQSCTAGRASFITGQCGLRTGLTKVGLPGSDIGSRTEDPTIARVMKHHGYRTGQFGKNHLGDRNEHLPTMHGFDEFFGNLYHLNAEEEPENEDYPNEADFPNFRKRFGPRGVLHSWADGDGGQRIEDTGPLTRERMETCDTEFLAEAKRFIRDAVAAGQPFFVWFNTTHMHFRTYAPKEIVGQAGRWQSIYHDVMVEHDKHVGVLLDLLDELGVTDDTLVMYSTDNGPHGNSWPDAATAPFRSEKNSNWEGAYRVPAVVRWPGRIAPGSVSNEIVAHLDWLPTFAAMAGDADLKERLKQGAELDGRQYKVHLDGYNLLPHLTGGGPSPRKDFFYFNDDGDIVALRYDNWKVVFLEQRAEGTLRIWAEPFTELRVPKIFNLRTDPLERADITSNTYYDWLMSRVFLLVPAQAQAGAFLKTFLEFPPRQEVQNYTLSKVMAMMRQAAAGGA